MSLTSVVAEILAAAIIVAPVLWLVGRALVGKDKAKFTHALWIAILGVIIGAVLGMFIQGIVGLLVGLLVTPILWVYLIKHFFETGWVKALVVAFLGWVVLWLVIAALIVVLGLAVGAFGF